MTLRDVQDWMERKPGDPADKYISPDGVKNAFAQTYADFQTAVAAW